MAENKILYTQDELLAFEKKYRASYQKNMRYGQALMHHFHHLKDSDFEGFNMFYESMDALTSDVAWEYAKITHMTCICNAYQLENYGCQCGSVGEK